MNEIKLTNDAYGYHTAGLKCRLDQQQYDRVVNTLYALANERKKSVIYPIRRYSGKSHRCHCSTILSNDGILLYFTDKKGKNACEWKYMVKAVVNPRRVLAPKDEWKLGIMPNRADALEEFSDRFTLLMRSVGLPDQLDEWHLIRLDLCVNLQCGQQKTAREYLRLLNKDDYRGRWARILYIDPSISPEMEEEQKKERKKEERKRNKHYLQLENGTLTVVVYDKIFQLETEGLCIRDNRLPKGVLRVEVRCEKRYLKQLRKENDLHGTMEQLDFMRVNSRELILEQLRRAFPTGRYGKLTVLYASIEHSGYHAESKEQMKWLSTTMQRKKKLKAGQELLAETYNLSGSQIEYRMKQFKQLSVNPIPLTERFYLPQLPSLVEVLEELDDGSSTFVIDEDGKIKF